MIEIKVPELAESITEGTLVEWLKGVGDYVEQGEYIAELETDKVNIEIIADHAGVITELKCEPGDTVEVGQVIAVIDETASAGSAQAEQQAQEQQPKAEKAPQETPKTEAPAPAPATEERVADRVIATPAARKLARERGIDLSAVQPTDPLGRIHKKMSQVQAEQTVTAGKAASANASCASTALKTAVQLSEYACHVVVKRLRNGSSRSQHTAAMLRRSTK